MSCACEAMDGSSSNGRSGTTSRRLRVLVTAFACCPPGGRRFSGGEDVLGWHLVHQIARFHEAWVLTHALDREDIEAGLQQSGSANLRLEYVALPRWIQALLRVPGGIQCYCYLWQLAAYRAARRLTRDIHFDLVHHLTYANDWMASYVGALMPVPYLRGPGGGAHRVPATLLAEYTWRGRLGERLRTMVQWCFRHDPVFLRGQARASALLVCNREALNAVPSRWRGKAQLFPVNGISADDMVCLGAGVTAAGTRPLRVLSGGKLLRLKGYGLAIKAFALFSTRYPDARFDIIGDGPDRPHLEGLISRLGLAGRVRLRSGVRREAFLKALSECDIFLFPSLRDGGGAVVVEAMAAGKPVVCFRLGGPGQHVTPACGIAVQPCPPAQAIDALASALEQLARDPALRIRLGAAARERTLEYYHWDRLGDRLSAVYDAAVRAEARVT